MITDITKLYVDLSRIYLKNPQDISKDPNKLPVYDANNETWLEQGSTLILRHDRPAYIRYKVADLALTGGAVQIAVKAPSDEEYKYYYMAPVAKDNNDLVFEINLNEVASRDLDRGILNNVSIKFKVFENGNDGEITENSETEAITVSLYADLFSRTTVLTDIFLFNVYFNKIKEFIEPDEEYHKPLIYIEDDYTNSGLQYISQYDDVMLYAAGKDSYYSLACYFADPKDAVPDSELIIGGASNSNYENSFSHKFNLIMDQDGQYYVHLAEQICQDMFIEQQDTAYFVLKYLGANVLHQNSNVPITIHYYKTDSGVDAENIKNAFKEIHRYI